MSAVLNREDEKFNRPRATFDQARGFFQQGNRHFRSAKLTSVIWLTKISPKLAQKLFKTLRPDDPSLIVASDENASDP